jgi:hypothetical protein
VLVLAAALAACSSDSTGPDNNSRVTLSVVNALSAGVGAQFKLDQSSVALPTIGRASSLTVTSGSHRVQLSSASGQSLFDTSFSVAAGSRPTVVLTGSGVTSAGVSIATDTISTGSGGSGYHSNVGSILLVNSAPNLGPFDVLLAWGTDSVVRLGGFTYGAGSLPPPAPYSYYLPFELGNFVVKITNPGSSTALTSTNFVLAADDRWIVMLTTSIEGGLVLQATKQ